MASESWAGLSSAINVNELTEKIRIAAQDLQGCAQLASPPTGKALGLGKGDTGQYTFVPDLTPYNTGTALDENEPMPSSGVSPIKATFTIAEYGQAIAYTGKLEMLSRLDMDDVHMKALDNHRKQLENSLTYTQLGSTDWKFTFDATTPSSGSFVTNGTATKSTNVGQLDLDNLSYLRTLAKKNKIPFADGESYFYVTGADALEALESDSDLTTMLQEDSGRAALNGELGRIKQCRLIEDNHSISAHPQSYDEGFLVGADAVQNEFALPWEIRFERSDMGRSNLLAYYGLGAWFKVLDETTHDQEHIIHVTAAA